MRLMNRFFFASLVTLSLADIAFSESNICGLAPRDRGGVYCCLKSCESSRQILVEIMLNRRKDFRVIQEEAKKASATNTNCLGTAAYLTLPQIQRPEFFDEVRFENLLKLLRKVPNHEARPGDMMVLRENGKGFAKDPEVGRINMIMRSPVHAAIYLGDNLIFQKENAQNESLSYSTIEQARQTYWMLGGPYHFQGRIDVEFYRF